MPGGEGFAIKQRGSVSPAQAAKDSGQVSHMIDHFPAEDETRKVKCDHGLDRRGGREGEHWKEDETQLGVWIEGGVIAHNTKDSATGPQAVTGLPHGHLERHAGQGAHHSGVEIEGEELLLTTQVDGGGNEAVKGHHIATQVDQTVVRECV